MSRILLGLSAAVSILAIASCSSTGDSASSDTASAAPAGPPVETRSNNQQGYTPAFTYQTRAPAMLANAPVEVKDYVSSGIANPFSFEFLPSGNVIIAERAAGQFKIADKSGKIIATIKDGVPAVMGRGQGGLLDIVLDPKFATNQTIYWSYSEPQADGTNNTAVAKGKLTDGANAKLENVQVIYHQGPSLNSTLHFGSRLVFAKDGTLFVTQGERSILPGRVQAEDLKSGLGKVVRINTDGTIPKDNPFVGRADARPEIWSYGHRNVQGAFLNPKTGELWTMEHGPQGGDELNIARKGKDYGWPTITYGVEYGPARTKIGDANGPQQAGLEQPIYYYDPVIAPGAATYYDSNAIPKWKGSVFVAGLNSFYISRLSLSGDKVIGEERFRVTDAPVRLRDIGVGPDGALYVLTDAVDAKLIRVGPSATGQSTGLIAWNTDSPSRVNSTTITQPGAPQRTAAAPPAAPASPPVLVGGPAAEPPTPDASGNLLATVTLPPKTTGASSKLTVTTPGWANNADIPYEFTQYRTNTFPGLEWTKGPASTKSYAIIMQDSGMLMRGGPVLHWTLFNIPATVTKLEKGMAPDANPKGSSYGPNYQPNPAVGKPYLGPRTPPGPKHRYNMQVLALDITLPADFKPASYDELIAPMKGHVVASGNVIGLGQADPNAPPPPPRPAAPAAGAAPAATPAPAAAAPVNTAGKAPFDANCGICHATGENGAPLTATLTRLEPAAVVEKVTTGTMAGFAAALSPQQKRDVAEYVTGKKLP
jgi:Raf kinase inhibitor-like YbhB/YbcL family protein